MAQSTESVLIVGAGVFGTSTAYHLKKSYPSWRVTVVDRSPSPPEPAASTDINKIIRADYSVEFYSELAYDAIEAWNSWPELQPYYHRTGWVAFDEEGSDTAERIRRVFKKRGHDPTSDVALDQVEHRWAGCLSGTDLKGFRDAYWNPEAGWCEADKATASLMASAISLGVEYTCGEVTDVLSEGSTVLGVILGDDKTVQASKTIFAAGAWNSALLTGLEDRLGILEENRVERQAQAAGVAVAHYKLSHSEVEALREMPVVVYGENGEVIPPPPSDPLLKFTNANTFTNLITTKSGQRISVPPNRSQRIVSHKLQADFQKIMMDRVMPTFTRGKQAEYWRICWDSRTPSQDWLLSQYPTVKGLYLATGGSFHSYKFLPIIGKYMTNVITGDGNGQEKDAAWGWKGTTFSGRGAHEKTAPTRDLTELED